MAEDFYAQWLRIPPGPRPPDHYALLGLARFCRDQDAIETAARARLTRLDQYAMHPDRATRDRVQDMMDEVAEVRVHLIDPRRQQAYDEELARALGVSPPAAPAAGDLSALPGGAAAEIGPAAPAGVPAEEEHTANLFKARVWVHLRKWRLNPQEERFLVAEAAGFGIEAGCARKIVRGIDREAESRAEKVTRRTTAFFVGLGLAAAAALVLAYVLTRAARARREESFNAGVSRARACLADDDVQGAEKHLASAGEVFPQRPVLRTLGEELAAKRKELSAKRKRVDACLAEAGVLMAQGELARAEAALGVGEKILPEHPRVALVREELEKQKVKVPASNASEANSTSPANASGKRTTAITA